MRQLTLPIFISSLLLFITACSGQDDAPDKQVIGTKAANEQAADFVYTDGKVYTVNDQQPWAEAVAVKGN